MLAKQFHDPNNVSLGELGKRQGCKKSYIATTDNIASLCHTYIITMEWVNANLEDFYPTFMVLKLSVL